jgi:serine/threonine protein phosphatase PrpC
MNPILKTAAGNRENQDRGAVIHCGAGLVLVVADGAGGISGGERAAVMAVELVRQDAERLCDSSACAKLLQEMDRRIMQEPAAGETTCALAVVTGDLIFGASVGDSGIWIVGPGAVTNVTQRQSRKPFLGSGSAWAVDFTQPRVAEDRLLLATDGLLKYSSAERIIAICRDNDAKPATDALIELVRYPSGGLPDDITVILTDL